MGFNRHIFYVVKPATREVSTGATREPPQSTYFFDRFSMGDDEENLNRYIFLSLQAEMLDPISLTVLYFPVQMRRVLRQILQPACQSI